MAVMAMGQKLYNGTISSTTSQLKHFSMYVNLILSQSHNKASNVSVILTKFKSKQQILKFHPLLNSTFKHTLNHKSPSSHAAEAINCSKSHTFQ